MKFTHIDINFDVKYDGHQNCSKTLSMHDKRFPCATVQGGLGVNLNHLIKP